MISFVQKEEIVIKFLCCYGNFETVLTVDYCNTGISRSNALYIVKVCIHSAIYAKKMYLQGVQEIML